MHNFIDKISPLVRIRDDPIQFDKSNSVQPISVSRLRVTPLMKRRIKKQRREFKTGFDFIEGLRVTIMIPFNDRDPHLNELAQCLTHRLRVQTIEYKIVVVEQSSEKILN